jgi:hypothetical protein
MKSFRYSALAPALCATLTVCCQSQPTRPQTTTIDSSGQQGEVLRNLIQDTVALSSFTDDDRAMLQRVYGNNRAVVSYRVIKDPFPRSDSLAVFRKIRCNMSTIRAFVAERTELRIDNGSRTYLVWEGKLSATGFVSDRPDYNRITLLAREDTSIMGGFRFSSGHIYVSNKELYEIETFDRYPSYFLVVQYNPNAGIVLVDSKPPVTR